jgi:CspA family cold shock protein
LAREAVSSSLVIPLVLPPVGCSSLIQNLRVAEMAVGTVKWFNMDKGFGFIAPTDGSKDVFVHITAVQAAGMSSLADGQKIMYDVVQERGKLAAANLKTM